jgi:hypothetical protein
VFLSKAILRDHRITQEQSSKNPPPVTWGPLPRPHLPKGPPPPNSATLGTKQPITVDHWETLNHTQATVSSKGNAIPFGHACLSFCSFVIDYSNSMIASRQKHIPFDWLKFCCLPFTLRKPPTVVSFPQACPRFHIVLGCEQHVTPTISNAKGWSPWTSVVKTRLWAVSC